MPWAQVDTSYRTKTTFNQLRYSFRVLNSNPMENPESMNYPEKTCTIDRLLSHSRLVAKALAGEKTQQRRNGVYGYPGERFELEGQSFEITRLWQETLDDMGDAGAQTEGYPSMEGYKNLILRMHKGMQWDGAAKVWVHEFKAV